MIADATVIRMKSCLWHDYWRQWQRSLSWFHST
jgi:hypothetical protein